MRVPSLYCLPPAGQKIPIERIAKGIASLRKGPLKKGGKNLRKYLGCKNLFFLSSGRAALWVALKALWAGKENRNEVIIPAYTCPAVAAAILRAGLRPVLCDNNLEDFGYELKELENKITGNTLAVVAVHLFGFPANIGAVGRLCRSNDIYLIEDAAQAFGNTAFDPLKSKLGLIGDLGFFSFGRGKPLSLLHGGVLAVNSPKLIGEVEKVYKNLCNNGSHQGIRYALMLLAYRIFINPYFYRIPQLIPSLHLGETIFEEAFDMSRGLELAANLVEEMLDQVEREKAVRAGNSHFYFSQLKGMLDIQNLAFDEYPFLRYPLLVKKIDGRRRIQKKLHEEGTGGVEFYPSPLNEIPVLKEVLQDKEIYRNAQLIAASLITLPVHSGLTPRHREGIVKRIKREITQ